jgi:hypothetical protein
MTSKYNDILPDRNPITSTYLQPAQESVASEEQASARNTQAGAGNTRNSNANGIID